MPFTGRGAIYRQAYAQSRPSPRPLSYSVLKTGSVQRRSNPLCAAISNLNPANLNSREHLLSIFCRSHAFFEHHSALCFKILPIKTLAARLLLYYFLRPARLVDPLKPASRIRPHIRWYSAKAVSLEARAVREMQIVDADV
jgi:hypothetical protein